MPKYTLIRHGRAGKADRDEDRMLTKKGREQANKRAAKLGDSQFDVIISSSASRAMETASCFSNAKQEIIPLDELYFPSDEEDNIALENMFDELECATLRTYLDNDKTGVMMRYAQAMADAVKSRVLGNENKNVLIVGHAVLLNALAYILSRADKNILDYNLDECEGIYINKDGNATYLQ